VPPFRWSNPRMRDILLIIASAVRAGGGSPPRDSEARVQWNQSRARPLVTDALRRIKRPFTPSEAIMKRVLELKRRHPLRQRTFDFLERRRRHECWFKRWILAATCLTLALVLETLPRGRYLMAGLASEARQAARYAIGVPTPREEIADSWRRYRLLGIAESRG